MKFILILSSLCLIGSCLQAKSSHKNTATTPPPSIAENIPHDSIYNLESSWTDQNGKSLSLSEFRGQSVVISMVYLKCQFSCPLTVAQMKEVEKFLTPEVRNKTHFVIATFDTVNDTPEAMLKYTKKNKLPFPNWIFLTTKNESNVRELSSLIDFKYKKLESGEYEHSYAIIALDEEGRIIGRTEGSEMKPKTIADLLNNQRAAKDTKVK